MTHWSLSVQPLAARVEGSQAVTAVHATVINSYIGGCMIRDEEGFRTAPRVAMMAPVSVNIDECKQSSWRDNQQLCVRFKLCDKTANACTVINKRSRVMMLPGMHACRCLLLQLLML